MKGKVKQTKGITLIALIITIIILLILAVVSIRLVMNDGILGKAESATTAYGTAEEQEQIKIGYADYQMAQASGEANPTLAVSGAATTGNGPWTVEFTKTGNAYTLSADGKDLNGPITQETPKTIMDYNGDNRTKAEVLELFELLDEEYQKGTTMFFAADGAEIPGHRVNAFKSILGVEEDSDETTYKVSISTDDLWEYAIIINHITH